MGRAKSNQKIDITIVGAGTLATSLSAALRQNGYRIDEVVSRDNAQSLRRTGALAKRVAARPATFGTARFSARMIWICVPDDAIEEVARLIADRRDWSGKIVLHSSGAIGSTVLDSLKSRGANIASAHPLMTFVNTSKRDLIGVPFALEGDSKALNVVAAVVRKLRGKPFRLDATLKPAYHAFGFFSSPALVELIAAAQQAGKLAGLSKRKATELMEPIVRQTIDNCFRNTPEQAFSGPLRRGDAATIRKHLEVLKQAPEALEVYRALAHIGLRHLPVRKAAELKKLIG